MKKNGCIWTISRLGELELTGSCLGEGLGKSRCCCVFCDLFCILLIYIFLQVLFFLVSLVVFGRNVAFCIGNVIGQVDLRYLLGKLNSRYASVLLANLRGRGLSIYPKHLRNMPIPLVSQDKQQPIIALVNQILLAKKENAAADTGELERLIDGLVYGVYGVTEEEIGII